MIFCCLCIEGSELFEGDIILTSSQYRAAGYETVEFKRSVDQVGSGEVPILSTASQNDLLQTWPDARVPYAFNQLLGKLQVKYFLGN